MSYPDLHQLPTLGSRLEWAMKQNGLSQERLAELVGITQASIQKLISGKSKSSRYTPAIARKLGVDINWLEIGTQPESVTPRDSMPLEIGEISTWDDGTPLDNDEVEVPVFKEIEMASGIGRSSVQMMDGRKVRFSRYSMKMAGVDPGTAACAKNIGNSNHPLILDGSTIGIDRGMTRIVDGQIYAIDHDGLLRIKFIYRLPGGGLRLRSYNREEYPDEEYTFDQIMEQRVQILGRVWWWSTLNPVNGPPLL